MRSSTPGTAVVIATAVAALSGCGGGTKTTTKTVEVPATAATPATTSTTPATDTTPTTAATPEATATPTTSAGTDDTRKDPITVKGRKGDGLTLLGQYSTSISGTPKARVKVKATLLAIRGPFSGFDLAAGHKLIGFDVRVTNIGAKRFDDPLPSGTLILVGGENGKQTNLISGSNANPCDNPSLKLKQGQSKQVCIAFDVPKNAKLETFQFAVDSGYGDTALWRLR